MAKRRTGTIEIRQPRGASGLYTRDYPGFEMLIEDLRQEARDRGAKAAVMVDRWGRRVVAAHWNGQTTYGSRSALAGTPPR